MKTTRSILVLAVGAALSASVSAGTFIFAESQENPDIIAHPIGYTGAGGTLSISVCIATTSESKNDLEIPVQNAISTWTTFQPSKTNVTRNDPELAGNQFDVESVLLHEVGHCIGLSHSNLANESNLPNQDDWDYAKTLKTGGNYDLGIGGDGIRGSHDDQRGDDVNLNWFRIGSNDPFLFESEIDLDTYTNDLADLPGGHAYVEIATYDVSQLRGEGSGEGVMKQGTFNQESQRQIHPEDATTIRIGRSGSDENQGTADDYDFELIYGGISDDCDITIEMTGDGFGVCNVQATNAGLPANHWSITEGTITLGSTGSINWYFNDTPSGVGIFYDRFEQ